MNLKELKDRIIAAYEWDRKFGDEVRNVETYEELANVIKDRENFYPINADWIRAVSYTHLPVGVHAIAEALKPLFLGEYERVDLERELETLRNMSFSERYQLILQ